MKKTIEIKVRCGYIEEIVGVVDRKMGEGRVICSNTDCGIIDYCGGSSESNLKVPARVARHTVFDCLGARVMGLLPICLVERKNKVR